MNQSRYTGFKQLYFILSVMVVACSTAGPNQKRNDALTAAELVPYGRTDIQDGKLELIGSAVHFGFSFEGKECKVFANLAGWQDHNYLQYELDGVYQKRIRVSRNTTQPIVISAPTGGRHTVWLYKATEAHTGPIFIEKITARSINAIRKPDLPYIEFIGNSITCGAAADPSEVPCGTGEYHDQHNAYQAYGPRLARTMNVNYIMSSVSGIGIYRNWNSDGPTMPQVYEKADLQAQSTRTWNFNTYQPRVVNIALGTNDFSNGDGKKARLPFDSALFVGNYVRFVQMVRSKHPQAQIALLSSPMINGDRRTTLQNCLSAVKTEVNRMNTTAKPVVLYFFKPMQARGCTGHPNVEDHAILADELLPFFRDLMQKAN
jgi:lysophospholipase L1-like esterase